MSEPVRYEGVCNDWNGEYAGLAPTKDGDWVKWEDYARLKAELTDLKSEADRFKAEVERLRKAGDELRDSLPYIVDERLDDKTMRKIMNRWNAAKEGKFTE